MPRYCRAQRRGSFYNRPRPRANSRARISSWPRFASSCGSATRAVSLSSASCSACASFCRRRARQFDAQAVDFGFDRMLQRAPRHGNRARDIARPRQRLDPGQPGAAERRIDARRLSHTRLAPRLRSQLRSRSRRVPAFGSSRFDNVPSPDASSGPSICSVATILWVVESSTSTVRCSAAAVPVKYPWTNRVARVQIRFADGSGRTRGAGDFRRGDAGRGAGDPVERFIAGEIVERKQRVARRRLRGAGATE